MRKILQLVYAVNLKRVSKILTIVHPFQSERLVRIWGAEAKDYQYWSGVGVRQKANIGHLFSYTLRAEKTQIWA